ncbi:hypothetical protein CHARACLAT_015187 [Characodon lateralis]|uniref:Secreted protein n=1 Tax=Characodon lateralis TaxID=208331 RepID=A0ABU7DIW8_9TELE|nr:hypothetical protein [Characodon lateralis]
MQAIFFQQQGALFFIILSRQTGSGERGRHAAKVLWSRDSNLGRLRQDLRPPYMAPSSHRYAKRRTQMQAFCSCTLRIIIHINPIYTLDSSAKPCFFSFVRLA